MKDGGSLRRRAEVRKCVSAGVRECGSAGVGATNGIELRRRGPSPACSGSHPLPQAGEGINVAHARGAFPLLQLKPRSASAASRDGACRFPSGGFTRSSRRHRTLRQWRMNSLQQPHEARLRGLAGRRRGKCLPRSMDRGSTSPRGFGGGGRVMRARRGRPPFARSPPKRDRILPLSRLRERGPGGEGPRGRSSIPVEAPSTFRLALSHSRTPPLPHSPTPRAKPARIV
jgi:hypothetical protein